MYILKLSRLERGYSATLNMDIQKLIIIYISLYYHYFSVVDV